MRSPTYFKDSQGSLEMSTFAEGAQHHYELVPMSSTQPKEININIREVTPLDEEIRGTKPWLSVMGTCSTLINILLATGPFTLPYAFKEGGVYLAVIVFWFTSIVAFLSADIMIDVIAQSSAIHYNGEIQSAIMPHPNDSNIQESKFFIKTKREIGALCDDFVPKWTKSVFILFLAIYMYGAMLIKCVSASLSFDEAFSFLIFGSSQKLSDSIGFDFYYISIFVFAALVTVFCIGNIENSKWLQIIVVFMRFFSVILMIIGCLYGISKNGAANWNSPKLKKFDFSQLHFVFGNTIFINMIHHSIPGIFYPMRPQKQIRKTLFWCFSIGTCILTLEGLLAVLAFGDLSSHQNNPCDKFPCPIQNLFNINFMAIPFISQVVNFYPMLNVAAYPVLAITLRNNFLQFLNKEGNPNQPLSLRRRVIYTLIITGPVYIISAFLKDEAQILLAYTGGYTGLIILLIVPTVLIVRANYRGGIVRYLQEGNIHKTLFQKIGWQILLWTIALLAAIMVTIGLVKGSPGH